MELAKNVKAPVVPAQNAPDALVTVVPMPPAPLVEDQNPPVEDQEPAARAKDQKPGAKVEDRKPAKYRAVYGLLINPVTGRVFVQERATDPVVLDGWEAAQEAAGKIRRED